MNYPIETTVITNIGKDFEKPECMDALNLMGVTDVVAHMLENNQKFNELFISRVVERAENNVKGTIELIKEAVRITSYNVCYTKLLRFPLHYFRHAQLPY